MTFSAPRYQFLAEREGIPHADLVGLDDCIFIAPRTVLSTTTRTFPFLIFS